MYGPERDTHTLVLATPDGIIQDSKRLRATAMLVPEQSDYFCAGFAKHVTEWGLYRLF